MALYRKPGIHIPRPRRIKYLDPQDGYYHIISRALQKEMRFGGVEKHTFLTLLKWLSQVYFVRLATFSILDNHVHLVLKMIPPEEISKSELERRLSIYYEHGLPRGMEEAFEQGDTADYYAHFSDISMFMWDLKLRFARWYNKVHQGYGHVWAERFTSVLVVGAFALRACMIYVELNALRAGIVTRPEEYTFCGLSFMLKQGRHARCLDFTLLKEAVYCYPISATCEEHSSIVEAYYQAVYSEGMNLQPSSERVTSITNVKNASLLSESNLEKSVFITRIKAMTEGDYIDDFGVCADLFAPYWDQYCRTKPQRTKVFTLPYGQPLEELVTLLKRPLE